jgi:hypothetical protein
LKVAAEALHKAVPAVAEAKAARPAGEARAAGPAARKPSDVVLTTSSDRRALDSERRLERLLLPLMDADEGACF